MNNFKYLIAALIVSLFSCFTKADNNQLVQKQLDQQKKILIGKSIKSLNKIISDTLEIREHVVFLYNEFDCGTCVKNGFSLVNFIDSTAQKQFVYAVTTSINIGTDQLKYNYKKYVFYDEHDCIRSELKYISTPVLLFIDSTKKIGDVYYPTNGTNSFDKSSFVNICVKACMKNRKK